MVSWCWSKRHYNSLWLTILSACWTLIRVFLVVFYSSVCCTHLKKYSRKGVCVCLIVHMFVCVCVIVYVCVSEFVWLYTCVFLPSNKRVYMWVNVCVWKKQESGDQSLWPCEQTGWVGMHTDSRPIYQSHWKWLSTGCVQSSYPP